MTYYPWREMSVGSHFTIYSRDKRALLNALKSEKHFRKTHDPLFRISYRTHTKGKGAGSRPGWTFWRVR